MNRLNVLKTKYNNIGITCDEYLDFCSKFLDESEIEEYEGYGNCHHVLITSIFGEDNPDNILLELSSEDHTRAHLILVRENLDKFKNNISMDLIRIYKSLDMRYYRNTNWYPEDLEWYKSMVPTLNQYFYEYLGYDYEKEYDSTVKMRDARWSTEEQRLHQSLLSSVNYAVNTEMVRKMKENSVFDSEKQSRKTSLRNFRQYTVLKLLDMYDNNYEFNNDNYRDMYSYQTKYNHVWWEFLLYKTYYLKYYGLRQDILDKWYKEADEYVYSDAGKKTKKWLNVTGIDVDDQNFSFSNEAYQMDLFPDITIEEEDKIKAFVKRINESN